MAYQSLYRRYRPQRFSEVRGQPHVVTALRNAVRDGRTGHAYLFSGPRGTGKTSTARILAKALNCTDLHDGEPCGACESCQAIEAGTSYDLHELDAASNNGVDAVRDLIEKTSYGTSGRTKVYILDEVHMLSRAASNALLKTLEEPPAHVVFVLATTDPQKVLPTIRSRTQHFEFHLLPMDELEEYVRWVASDAGLDVDEEAVTHVLRVGGGSARDTLSALDQVVAAGGVLTGAGGLDDLVDALCDADAGRALVAVDEALAAGRDARLVGEELLARLRDVFLCRMGVPLDRLPEGDRARITGWAERLGDRAVTRAMELLGDAITEISHQALDPRVSLEVALLRIARPEADADVEALAARIDRLEKALAGAGGLQPPSTDQRPRPSGGGASGAAPPRGGAAGDAASPGSKPTASASPGSTAEASEPSSPAGRSSEPAPAGGGAASARAALNDRRRSSADPSDARPSPQPRGPSAPPPTPTAAPPTPGSTAAPSAPSTPAAEPARPSTSSSEDPDTAATSNQRQQTTGEKAKASTEGSTSPDAGATSGKLSDPPKASAPATAGSTTAPSSSNGSNAVPDRDMLTVAWADSILPGLSGLTRAMFSVGRFVDAGSDGAAVFALPNAVHRDKCEAKRADVEHALEEHFGHAVPLRLVVDESGASTEDHNSNGRRAPGGRSRPGNRNSPAVSSEPGDPEEPIDLDALEDAPPDPRTPIDRIAEAFPGARVEAEE